MTQPVVAVVIPAQWRSRILSPAAEAQLTGMAEVRNPRRQPISPSDLPGLLDRAVACLTGWGTPALTEDLLTGLPDLRLVAHTAGSIRALIPEAALRRGLRVSHAAFALAQAVAEHVVAAALLCLQQQHAVDQAMRAGEWESIREGMPRRLLAAQVIGIWGAGKVGQLVARLLSAFGCRVLISDPHITSEQASGLGTELVGLEELFSRANLVSLHAPALPETRGRVDAPLLARLRDGAVLINTARAALVDDAALFRELESGRIRAALDVFSREPLPADSPVRRLPNVVLSPHVGGHSEETHLRQGQAMVEEVGRFLRGEALIHEVKAEMLPIMA